jgi:hypothetical protein
MLETLGDIGLYGLENLAVPVAAAWATATAVAARGARGQVADHDRQAAYLSEDVRRWVLDRDRVAQVRMHEITQQAHAQGVGRGGTLTAAAGKVYRQVMHEWRDEATGRLRELDELLASEGPVHASHRRRHGRGRPWLGLPQDCRDALAGWRERAESDPTASEPMVRELEQRDPWTTAAS